MAITRHGHKALLRAAAHAAAALVAGVALLAADGLMSGAVAESSTLERLREQGFARIAIANEPPYTEVTPGGKVTGAAPEVVRAVMKKLGVPEILGTVTEYGAMIPGLQAGRFDIIAAGLFMRPQRCAVILYSTPDVCGAEAFAVKAGNPLGLESFGDVAANEDAKVGVCGGCTEEMAARNAGVPDDRIVIVESGPSGIKMLQSGRLDAYSLPALSIQDLLKKADDPNLEMVTPLKDTEVACAGAGFRRSDVALRDAYDEALQELKDSGEFAEIVESFGFPAKLALLTSREDLCGGPNVP